MKKFKQWLHGLWYSELEPTNKDNYYDNNGVFLECLYKLDIKIRKQNQKDEQREKRAKLIALIFAPIFSFLLLFCLFKIVICIGLFIGCILMLMNG